jgi:vancomycin resistance protein YoaR
VSELDRAFDWRQPRRRSGRGVGVAVLLLVGLPLLLVVLGVAAWAVDTSLGGGGVPRNVELVGHDVGGMPEDELRAAVADMAAGYGATQVHIVTPDGTLATTAAALGMTLDQDATVAAVLDIGADEPVYRRPLDWATSFLDPRQAPLRVTVDRAVATETVAGLEGDARQPPVEPTIKAEDGRLVAVPGRPGRGVDAGAVAAALPAAAAKGADPVVVRAEQGDVPPRFDLTDAQQAADRATELAAHALWVRAGDTTAAVPEEVVRSWLRAVPGEDGLELLLAQGDVEHDLPGLLSGAGTPAVSARFELAGGRPRVVPGHSGAVCCEEIDGFALLAALEEGSGTPVELDLRTVRPDVTTDEAASWGVNGVVSTFTTNHAAGEPRVTNIHRMADIVRGQVIPPGGTFSINEFVGERTTAKGFVNAPVIYQGEFAEDIGGGVSQFATTLFNAAFYAGLEFDEYQSHSIYISRYPYGVEATLSYPHPDLIVSNPSPYGVMIWPTYTDSSITVTLYSTRWADVRLGAQTQAPQGSCTRVTTERVRTFVRSGRTEVDEVYATYRPGEGVDC